MSTSTPRRMAGLLIMAACCLVGSTGCKPSAPSPAGQNPTPRELAAPSPAADAQHRPGADDLAHFLRSQVPTSAKLTELKNDPPVPLPGAAAGSNAWLYNVRVVFAPAEDLLGAPAPQAAAAFQSAVDELNSLATWSQAYARSSYASRYPGFAVDPPSPAHPRLLALLHAKDKPYAPLYGKLSAEWQVDRWHYAVQRMSAPTDDEGGQPRSEYGDDPILIQGSPEAGRFFAQVQTGLEAARTKKAALDAAYHADLVAATRTGTTYKGQITHGKTRLPAEARFLAAAPGDEPNTVRLEFRLFHPDYVYLCTARLADSPPLPAASTAAGYVPGNGEAAGNWDLAADYLRVTGPKVDSLDSANFDFRSSALAPGPEKHLWLHLQDHGLAGNLTLYPFQPPYFFSGQEAP